MEKLIRVQSVEHFRRLLKNNPDDAEREALESLIADEEAKAANEQTFSTNSKPPALRP
jgi:hypothetical protein